MRLSKIWQNYNLSVVLFVMFIVSWAIQTWVGWVAFQHDQIDHAQSARIFGPGGYIWDWAESTFENWQSEFLQLFTFVILTACLIHKGSHESKDEDERVQRQLNRIEEKLNSLTQKRN